MNRGRVVAVVAVGALLATAVIAAFLYPSAVDVARGQCARQGIPTDGLAVLRYSESGNVFGKTGTVEFQMRAADPPKKVVVNLRQYAFFLPWQVVELR